MKYEDTVPEILSIAQMCKLLQLSRSRFYSLITLDKSVFLPPIYSLKNQKPYFTAEMAKRNLEIKRNNLSWDRQEVVLFYSARVKTEQIKPKQKTKQIVPDGGKYAEMIENLKSLGLSDITVAQVESAIKICFPNGVQDVEEAEVLRAIFRHLKRQNSTDNVRR